MLRLSTIVVSMLFYYQGVLLNISGTVAAKSIFRLPGNDRDRSWNIAKHLNIASCLSCQLSRYKMRYVAPYNNAKMIR